MMASPRQWRCPASILPSRPFRRTLAGWALVASCIALLAVLALFSPLSAGAQTQAPQAGSAELGLLLRQLDGEKRVLMIAAHPDDEDTSLLTTLARGYGARTAYLSLSRGEGGQNLIGPELDEGLGIVRTGELLSARSLDGAQQYFARAFDWGFSRSAEETFRHWPREELVRDVVWVVRTFRPHVIVSVFTGTPRDGHGQHQAAGAVSLDAFEAAGDPSRFPDQLGDGVEPWTPVKLYRSTRFRPGDTTLEVPTGRMDPLLGRSHFQVAMASRSQHRSQDMGAPQTPGPRSTGLELVESRVEADAGVDRPDPAGDELFAGVDTTLVGIAGAADLADEQEVLHALDAYREALASARDGLLAEAPERVAPDLQRARRHLDAALEASRTGPSTSATTPATRELVRVLEARLETLSEALLAAGSVVVDIRLARDRAAPGEEVEAQVLVWNGGPFSWSVEEVELPVPPGWDVVPLEDPRTAADEGLRSFFAVAPETLASAPPSSSRPATVDPGSMVRWAYRIQVADDAEPSRLYYLREDREGSLYRWPEDRSVHGLPGNPPLLKGAVRLALEGEAPGRVIREAVHVDVDKALGEFRVPFLVVPALSVAVDLERIVWPADRTEPRSVTVRVTNHSAREREGHVELHAPEGWTVEPASHSFDAAAGGGEAGHDFRIRPVGGETSVGGGTAGGESAGGESAAGETAAGETAILRGEAAAPDRARIQAVVHSGGRTYVEGLDIIDYPHIDPVPLYRDAVVEISRFPVTAASGIRVGYLMGPGDGGMQALRDLGIQVEPLGPEEFRGGELDRFDAIVLGIRAYETRSDLLAANDRLLDFARRGGTVVVQYNKWEFPEGGFAPYPLQIRRPHDRVTDPEAPVTFLRPDHPALAGPNRITGEDFQGWIQERGLYFLSEFDPRYTPLLEMSDPGQEANRGSLVVARVGEGAYVYTGLALFRQFPHGVPGAFRLLANLVSLSGDDLDGIADGAPEAEEGGSGPEDDR